MNREYLGKDIFFDEEGDLLVSATGDLETVTGLECLQQDLRDRLETMPGDLYAHPDWGCNIRMLLGALSTSLNARFRMLIRINRASSVKSMT